MFSNEPFTGDQKVGGALLWPLEQKFIRKFLPYIPKWIHGYQLTLLTIVWCAVIVVAGYLSRSNPNWLWLTSAMIFLQWLTDSFDGALGKTRDFGIPRWGFYMDHFLDYIFLCSILIGYSYTFNDEFNSLFYILVIFGAFVVNSYLAFAATNEFRIEFFKIGPTEMRLAFIIVNTLLVLFHKTYLAWLLPIIWWLSLAGLVLVVYNTQKRIWKKDMGEKRNRTTTTFSS